MITSTITECKGKTIIVNPVNMKVYRNKETMKLECVSAYELELSFYGEYDLPGFLKAVRKVRQAVDMNDIVIGIVEKSFEKSSVKFEMPDEEFMEHAHLIGEKESRLTLITRTITSYNVEYKVVKEDETFESRSFTSKTNDPKKLKKLLEMECEKDNSVLFKIGKPEESTALYGIERSDFVKYGKAVR